MQHPSNMGVNLHLWDSQLYKRAYECYTKYNLVLIYIYIYIYIYNEIST